MLENILSSCKYVMDNAKYLKINYNNIDKFIKDINCSHLKHWLSNNPYGLLDLDVAKIVNFLLIYESIDYSFWGNPKWTIETEEGLKDGSDALLYVMLKFVKENETTDFSNISKNKLKSILNGNVEIPLFEERYNTLQEVSTIVNEKMNGNFYDYIKDIITDKELFNVIINNFPNFRDVREYDGKIIHFYKLAQLLTSDILHIRNCIESIKVDYSNLLGCADYKIPQIMRALDLVEYDAELSSLVDNKKELGVSSKYEVEIRASMIVVIHYIKKKLDNTYSIDINDYFFTASKKLKQNLKPYHLTRNTNY